MPVKNLSPIDMSQFSLGRNGKDDPTDLVVQSRPLVAYCTEQVNIRTNRNEIENRPGERLKGTAISGSDAVVGIGTWGDNLVATHGTNAYIFGTDWTIFKTGLTSQTPTTFLEYYNDLYCSNGVDTPFRSVRNQINGALVGAETTIPVDDADKFIDFDLSVTVHPDTVRTGYINGDTFTYLGISALTIIDLDNTDSPYTTTLVETTINFDATAGNSTVNLITAVGNTGKVYLIRKTDATANTVTVDGAGGQKIDGTNTRVLAIQGDFVLIISNGVDWDSTSLSSANFTILDNVTGVLAHDDNSVVTTTFDLPNVPPGLALAEYGEKLWAAAIPVRVGFPTNPWNLSYSVTSTVASPSNFYDFTSPGSDNEFLGQGAETAALLNYRDTLLIGKKDGILIVDNFTEEAVPAPVINDFFKDDGPINEDCMILVNKDVVYFTGRRINRLSRPDVDNLRLDEGFDRPVLDILEKLDTDQSEAAMVYNLSTGLMFLSVKTKGSTVNNLRIVYNTDTGAWWQENNSFCRKYTVLNGITYFGHSVVGRIVQDDLGTTRDGAPDITFYESRHAKPSIPNRFDWRHLYLDGRLTENTIITVSLYVDRNLISTSTITKSDIVSSQASASAQALGDGVVGDSIIGDGDDAADFGTAGNSDDTRKPFEKVIPIGVNGKVFYYVLETNGTTQRYLIENAAVSTVALREPYRLQASN